jgi:hypothetical protein
MPKRTSLSDVACSSRSVSDFGWRLISFNGRACRGFRSAKWPGPTQSSPARPGPAPSGPRPRRPTPPPHAPLLLSLSHLDFPRSNLPLPPLSLLLPLSLSLLFSPLRAPPLLSPAPPRHGGPLKGKCALGPFLSILVIECQHKCFCVDLCNVVDKVQIMSKGMFLDLVHCFMD